MEILPGAGIGSDNLPAPVLIINHQLGQKGLAVAEVVPIAAVIADIPAPPAFSQHHADRVSGTGFDQGGDIVGLIHVRAVVLSKVRGKEQIAHLTAVDVRPVNPPGGDIEPGCSDFTGKGGEFSPKHRHGIAARISSDDHTIAAAVHQVTPIGDSQAGGAKRMISKDTTVRCLVQVLPEQNRIGAAVVLNG